MKSLLFVFLGGGLGSVLRFLVSSYTQKLWTFGAFPIGTFLVNVLGCYLIGLFSVVLLKEPGAKYFLVAGFCGGFTTFSAFASETQVLMQSSQLVVASLYVVLSVLIGVFAVYLGMNSLRS